MSAIAHWFHYLAWCAYTSDPACRPFVGLLALLGASSGALAILVLVLRSMLDAESRRTANRADRRQSRMRKRSARRVPSLMAPQKWHALGAALTLAPHAEPVLGEPAELRDEAARPPR
jgi:hypothetical protein